MATFSELMTGLADEVRRFDYSSSQMSISEMTTALASFSQIEELDEDFVVDISGNDVWLRPAGDRKNIKKFINFSNGDILVKCHNFPQEEYRVITPITSSLDISFPQGLNNVNSVMLILTSGVPSSYLITYCSYNLIEHYLEYSYVDVSGHTTSVRVSGTDNANGYISIENNHITLYAPSLEDSARFIGGYKCIFTGDSE